MGQSKPGLLRGEAGSDDAPGRCSICGAPAAQEFRPFCSRRCADVDLARWLRGAYAIPAGNDDWDEDGDDAKAAREPVSPAGSREGDGGENGGRDG
jgi:hypothetical protein